MSEKMASRLRDAMYNANVNQSELARAIGVSGASVSKYLSGINVPKHDKVIAMAKVLGVTPEYLYGNDTVHSSGLPSDLKPIEKKYFPLLGEIACGEPIFAEQHIETYIEAGENIKADYCIRCRGDSMIGAHIQDGDIVFIRSQSIVENGEIAAVLIGDETTLKKFYYDKLRSVVTLIAENERIPPLVMTGSELNDIKVLGKAVAVYHSLE